MPISKRIKLKYEIKKPQNSEEFQARWERLTSIKKDILIRDLRGLSIKEITKELAYRHKSVVARSRKEAYDKFGVRPQLKERISIYEEEEIETLFKEFASAELKAQIWGNDTIEPIDFIKEKKGNTAVVDEIYVSRPDLERTFEQFLQRTRGLCRIKGENQTGKSKFVYHNLDRLAHESHDIASIQFSLAVEATFENLELFLKWFCREVSRQLGLANTVNEHWDSDTSCSTQATDYFESHILSERDRPLALVLDDFDSVFEYPHIRNDFCRLLRAWHEKAQRGGHMGEQWRKVYLIILHSTEMYAMWNINSSPLAGVGKPITVKDFDARQLMQLMQQHGVDWSAEHNTQLMHLIGGHPKLATITAEALKDGDSWQNIQEWAATTSGIYNDYLWGLRVSLAHTPDLAKIYQQLIVNDSPLELEPMPTFQLNRMGLTRLEGDISVPRNDLYRQYFSKKL